MKLKKTILLATALLAVNVAMLQAAEAVASPAGGADKVRIVPVPTSVQGVSECCLTLSGEWKVKYFDTAEQAEANMSGTSGWGDYSAERPFGERHTVRLLKRDVTLPADFSDKRIVVRLNGVAHYAKLFVNGRFVRDHWGSFMAWTGDITQFVGDAGKVSIMLMVDETREGLAEFINGDGLQRDVQLMALPKNYVASSRVETLFDDAYKDAVLRLKLDIDKADLKTANKVKVELTAPNGRRVHISPSQFDVPAEGGEMVVEGNVKSPLKWDAEHPNLYRMTLTLTADGKVAQTIERNVGFREVELRGRNLFVNGQEVKLRGMWGGNSIAQLVSLNVNHTRQKWVTEQQLDSCDILGVYVLDENPVDFAKYGAESDPQYAWQWKSLMADLIERDYSHPSVIMWGLGNESFHGANVLDAYKYIKTQDTVRPVMYSWANRVKTTEEIPFDVYSYHYPDITRGASDVASYNTAIWHSEGLIDKRTVVPQMPVICDEYAHVVLSDQETDRDPNVRNFWGESLKVFWDSMYNTDGALGGDQFGLFTSLNNGTDTPEIWLTRKAYSPIHIEADHFDLPAKGEPLSFRMQNRFSHTDMREVTIRWSIGDRSGETQCSALAPAEWGEMKIPVGEVKSGDVVDFVFLRGDGLQVDEFSFVVAPEPVKMPAFSDKAPRLEESAGAITVSGDRFKIVFDKYVGLMTSAEYDGRQVITRGPILQFEGSNLSAKEWWCDSMSARMEGSTAVIDIEGNYAAIYVAFRITVDGEGLIATDYTIRHFPDAPPAEKTLPWDGTHVGGFSEIGVVYDLSPAVESLEWDRKALWTTYPEGHIGAPKGVAYKSVPEVKGKWATYTADNGNFSHAPGTVRPYNMNFLASKEYIRQATARLSDGTGVQVLSPESDAVRMMPNERTPQGVSIVINNLWNYPTLGLGNYMKEPIIISDGYSNRVTMRLVGR